MWRWIEAWLRLSGGRSPEAARPLVGWSADDYEAAGMTDAAAAVRALQEAAVARPGVTTRRSGD